jgi:hypothetical protein
MICGLRTIVLLLAVLGASSCSAQSWSAPPGKYQSYHEALSTGLEQAMTGPNWDDVPSNVTHRLAECATDSVVANITPAQLAQLDAAARGQGSAPAELTQQVERQLKYAFPTGSRGDFSALRPYCPADIPTFQKYVRD